MCNSPCTDRGEKNRPPLPIAGASRISPAMSVSSPTSPPRDFYRRLLRYLAGIVVVVLAVFAGTTGWYYFQMRGSLAQLDGEGVMPGAAAPIVIERDGLGIPTIGASSGAGRARRAGVPPSPKRFLP